MLRAVRRDDRWFMDYRNSDGSVSEMCGNGIRVFARYLHEHQGEPFPMAIDTRDGVKTLDRAGDDVTADMGVPEVLGTTTVTVTGRDYPARHVSTGNPHAVVFVDNLAEAGALSEGKPDKDQTVFYFKGAAESGLAVAQYRMGNYAVTGEAGPRDDKAALIWFRKAAEQKHPPSMLAAARMLDRGVAGAPDTKAGTALVKAAAEADRYRPNEADAVKGL